MSDKLSIVLNRSPFRPVIEFAIKAPGPRPVYASRIELTEVSVGDEIPFVASMDNAEAQELLNQLWSIGFRPADGAGNAGHVEALKDHIRDLRWMAESTMALVKVK